MKRFFAILAAVTVASGLEYDGLRVKIGWSSALADKEYFFKIPRTVRDVEAEGWRRTERPPGPLPELKMYCPKGRTVCPLFDTSGFVAGLQIALPVDEYESLAIKPEKKFVKWRAPAFENEPSRDYWTITQFYVSEESLKAGAGPLLENGATLQDGGVWVTGSDGRLLRIPSTEAELNSTTFKRQNCIPNMGTHYYYNMTQQMQCEDILPWFALTNQDELVGTGFQMFGKLAAPGEKDSRQWIETVSWPKQSAQLTIPFGPPCLYEWADSYGVISLHIYFIDKPWNIRCENGDSIKKAPAVDRLLFNSYRYGSKVADEFKKIFGG